MEAAELQFRLLVFITIWFHSSEFLLALVYHGRKGVHWSSFLVTKAYLLALGFGFAEHAVESYYFPNLKQQAWISNLGVALVLAGEVLRKLAVTTAKKSFTHEIRVDYSPEHKLVTEGIYSCIRHPGYLGFFVYAIGTQVLLCNPLGTIAYTIILWRFFEQRILFEEIFLEEFFGQQYQDYARRVPSGLPFVK